MDFLAGYLFGVGMAFAWQKGWLKAGALWLWAKVKPAPKDETK